MRSIAKRYKWILVALVVAGASVAAEASACVNDIDCPDPACGGQVCDWLTAGMTCQPAGRAAKGQDGWCTGDDDCKCKALGATCVSSFCTFTTPAQAPTGSGGTTGGAGTTGTGGTTGSAGTTGSGNTGGGDSGGGCRIAGAPSRGGAALGLVAGLVLGLGFVRRRRR